MYTVLSQGRVSMRGCCHVWPWLNVLSDVALSYFMLSRLTIIFSECIAHTRGGLIQPIGQDPNT